VGNDGETLVADSSTSTGLRYQVPVNVNPVLNSSFQVWQRGTSGSATSGSGTYVADRWSGLLIGATPANTITRQATSDTTNLPFIQYCARYQRTSGQTATGAMYLTQSMESVNSIPYAGKTITVSFYARKGANYSATSSILGIDVNSGTGTDQNINAGFTGNASVIAGSATLTTTWQRFTFTGTVSSSATQLGFYTYYSPTGTAGAADYYEITGFQLEVGSVATPFKTYGGTIQGELAACQRYYYRNSPATSGVSLGQGSANGSRYVIGIVNLPVAMRVAPTSFEFSALHLTDGVNAGITVAALAAYGNSPTTTSYYYDGTSGLTQYRNYKIDTSSSSGYLGFSAEL
jgi:hypothetical protein